MTYNTFTCMHITTFLSTFKDTVSQVTHYTKILPWRLTGTFKSFDKTTLKIKRNCSSQGHRTRVPTNLNLFKKSKYFEFN